MELKIKQVFDEWFDYKSKRVKTSTLSTYCNHFRYIHLYFVDKDMSSGVTNKEMTKFVEYLLSIGLSKKTAQDVKIVLTNILKYLSLQYDTPTYQYNIDYPTDNLGKRSQIKFFSKEDCKKVFEEMEKDPDPRLLGMVIGLTTGMRIGEICGLKYTDIDFDEKTISVNRTIERIVINWSGKVIDYGNNDVIRIGNHRQSSVVVANPPKTINSVRKCPVAKLPLKWLKEFKNTPFMKAKPNDCYVLSLSPFPIEPRVYRNYYYKELEKLGLPKLNPHCMRHTFATQMLHSGVDPATIASILGHSSPAVTLEIYSHTNEDEKKKQVNAVFGKMFK